MRIAQFDALSGDDWMQQLAPPLLVVILNPLGSYWPRGTMTSQQPRGWPLLSFSPHPSPGDCVPVSVSNCNWPVPAGLVTATGTSLESASLKYWRKGSGSAAYTGLP